MEYVYIYYIIIYTHIYWNQQEMVHIYAYFVYQIWEAVGESPCQVNPSPQSFPMIGVVLTINS